MKRSIIRLSFTAATLALALSAAQPTFAQTPPAGSPVATHGRLSVANGQIVNQHGEPVQLRGMSLYWSIAPMGYNYYNADVVSWLASDWNASVVRAAMGVERNFSSSEQGYIRNPTANEQRVRAVIAGARAAGIYVIIDWHSYGAELHPDEAVAFFKRMATDFKDVPNVIYEIYNEPNGIRAEGFTAAQNGGGPALSSNRGTPWSTIRTYMQRVTDSIRAIDQNNLIFIGTPDWCQRPDLAVDNPVTGNNLVYTAHYYAGQNDTTHRETLRSRITYAMRTKKQAIFISEFGITNAAGTGALNTDEADKWFEFLDVNKIGWANWSIGALSESSAALPPGASTSGGWPANTLSQSGQYIRNKLRSPPTTSQRFRHLTINIEGQGSVLPRWSTTVAGAAPYVFERDTTIYLRSSVTGPGWTFVGWSGDVTGTEQFSPALRMTGDKVVTARFQSTASTLPIHVTARNANWSVRRGTSGGLTLRGPATKGAVEAALYNVHGKLVSRTTYNAVTNGHEVAIGGRKLPAGNYMLVVRDKASKREMYSTRVTVTR